MAYTPEQLSDMQCIRDAALRYCRGSIGSMSN